MIDQFSTKAECDKYIQDNDLDAISLPRYSEDSGELLYYYVYYV